MIQAELFQELKSLGLPIIYDSFNGPTTPRSLPICLPTTAT